MWVALDNDPRGIASSVGSGITEHYKPVAVYSIEALLSANADQPHAEAEAIAEEEAIQQEGQPTTIAEVMAWARKRVAEIAGVQVDAVKLDLKLEP